MLLSFRKLTSRFALSLSALASVCVLQPQIGHASQLGDGFRQLGAGTNLMRGVALADLGLTSPVVLTGDASQEFYLSVPKGLPLDGASIAFDGRYVKSEPGTASVVISVDGQPVASQMVPDGDGLVQRAIAVPARTRDSGFVRLGVNWQSRHAVRRCDDDRSSANAMTVSPQTRLSYRIDPRSVTSLDDAWSTLPGTTTLLVAGNVLSKDAFDAAWRIGVALERSGKRILVRALPSVGEVVDTRGLEVPAALLGMPAFNAIRDNIATHRIANAAELGALLLVGASDVSGDVMVADNAMRARFTDAFDALRAQFAADADASAAFDAWRAQHVPIADAALGSKQIRLLQMGRQVVIAVASDAGAPAAAMFDASLHRLLTSSAITVPVANTPDIGNREAVRLSSLGGTADSFDVLARGDWTIGFPLNAVVSNGSMPRELTLYVAAAPGPAASRPVATVFWNGVLLAAKQLEANGRPEQLRARVPGYALGINNTLRVSVQRQPYSADCNEIPQAYPVNVLPAASYIRQGDAEPDGTFVGLLPLLAGNPQLIVSERYLSAAPENIERVIRIAAASGLSPSRAELTWVAVNQAVTPSRPFVAMEVAVDGVKPTIVVTDRKRLQIAGRDAMQVDVTGLQHLSTVEVVHGGGQDGVLWQAIGASAPEFGTPFLLNRGNLAVVGPTGPVAWFDNGREEDVVPPDADGGAFHEWRRVMSWGVPFVVVAMLLFIALVMLAARARRNKRSGN
ncbi:cellulose biosynthesis cyclic di-GMP-binding regulatory protein BcsB [Burkholderia anthina]|uniref:cellulose biosynthesis cyclic di-GMP-binding regulatory protein BcsB n=1 Tax=Burkholderia anthina TaxID=179879 RepID=UPI00158CB89A|nr:cellulose biosynthesis cyclic di-GMP-binding regulatory protein BcsB [Burkholderia anthina]